MTNHAQDYFVNVVNAEPIPVTLGSENITITGSVNVGTVVQVNSSPENPVHTHVTESVPIELGSTTLAALEHVSIDNFPSSQAVTGPLTDTQLRASAVPVSIASMPTTPVTGTFWQTTQPVSGSVSISSLPEVEIKNDSGNPIPVSGNVNATITDVITVVVNENAGEIFGLNNHATNANRGWTMDNTMRPLISIRVNPSGTSTADLIKIVEYELGNNNANQSTIMYEWYEGDLTIAGAAIPSWTTVGTKGQYRVYQDQYSSNQGNTFTIPSGTVLRHSGIIIGKNTSGDNIEKPLAGGNTGKIWTLCLKRLDNNTKLDVWFAFTIKELQ
jgi:hypothetical protein